MTQTDMIQSNMIQSGTVQAVQDIPGLAAQVRTDSLIEELRAQSRLPLEFWLNGEPLVGPGYHVTEVKAVTIEAMDCGGKAAAWCETVIQLMDGSSGDAAGGFMQGGKFLAIYDRVTSRTPVRAEAEARFEYGNAVTPAMQYHVTGMEARPERMIVHLRTPGVQCKAGEACGLPLGEVTAQAESGCGCAPDSGGCSPAPAERLALR